MPFPLVLSHPPERPYGLLAAQNPVLDSPRKTRRLGGAAGYWDIKVFCLLTPLIFPHKAATAPRIPSTRLALHHFDTSYGLHLGALWPSVRAGLLCEQKYGALLNNFAAADHVPQELELLNATNFVSEASQKVQQWQRVVAAGEAARGCQEGSGEGRTVVQAEIMTQAETSPLLSASISSKMKCYTFPRGDITRFRPAR